MKYKKTDKMGFEVETCSRCGGSGEYSFNLMYGRVCFKCGGSGKIYTNRGKLAHNYFTNLRRRSILKLTKGDTVIIDENRGKWGTVEKAYENDGWYIIELNTGKKVHAGYEKCYIVYGLQDQAQQIALAYQDTLTKTGKTRAALLKGW